MNVASDRLVLAFTGNAITADILKGTLETAEIRSIVRDEQETARLAGFGSIGKCEVFILESDIERARPIIEEFASKNP